MVKVIEPQGQACKGPRSLRSEPNFGGRLSLFFRSLGRRSIKTVPLRRFRAPPVLIRLTAHIVINSEPTKGNHTRRVATGVLSFFPLPLSTRDRRDSDYSCWDTRQRLLYISC